MQDTAQGAALWALRTLLVTAGGYVSAKGYADAETWQAASGAVLTLAAALWSFVARQRALATPPR